VFLLRNLSVLAYADGFTLWLYRAAALSDVGTKFFADADDLLAGGDMILVTSPAGGKFVVVTQAPDGLSVAALS
jgi:hypothetical protein